MDIVVTEQCTPCPDATASCHFKVCTAVRTGGSACAKGGNGNISHVCFGSNSSCTERDPTNKYESVSSMDYCQSASPGETVHIIAKDGNDECGTYTGTSDLDTPISCGANPGWTEQNKLGCSGGGNLGKECLWNITLPASCSAQCSPTPSPTTRPPSPTPSPTPVPTPQNNSDVTCGTCVIWGDPHIITFKAHERRLAQHPRREEFFRTRGWESDQININEAGQFWLVKSDSVRIQGRYEKNETSGLTYLASLIVGGPFLDGRVLQIAPMNSKTTWEGEEILPSIPTVFRNDLVNATYHNAAKMVKDGTVGPGIDVALPLGVTLTVNRWRDMLAAEISMCQTEDQSGQCGSYADDSY